MQFLDLHLEECKQLQQDGDENMVGINTPKVRHQVNTVHQL